MSLSDFGDYLRKGEGSFKWQMLCYVTLTSCQDLPSRELTQCQIFSSIKFQVITFNGFSFLRISMKVVVAGWASFQKCTLLSNATLFWEKTLSRPTSHGGK